MGIKCSLFGHAYGETAVERDREEQGSEVVITIREVETCRRCGETRVVSENKEVTTIETPDDVSVSDADEGGDGVSDGPTTETSVGAEIVDAEAGEPVSSTDAADTEPEDVTPEVGGDDAPSPDEDDGVILEDGEDEPERDPGEWPEDSTSDTTTQPQTPEAADGIERFEEGNQGADGTTAESAEATESTVDTAEASAGQGARADQSGDSEVWSEADPDLDAERPDGTVTVPEGQFRCPECGFTTPVASSSLREGDFCPECHQGTLVHESA